MPTNRYNRDRYAERKINGLCTRCPNKVDDGHPFCIVCRKKHNQRTNNRRVRLIQSNGCTSCGGTREQANKTKCNKCLERVRTERAKARRERVSDGLCHDCGIASETRRCCVCHLKMIAINLFGVASKWVDLKSLYDRQSGMCPYTGRKLILGDNCEIDHVVPRSGGGLNALDNLAWVYAPVNRMKHKLTKEAFVSLVHEIHKHTGGVA